MRLALSVKYCELEEDVPHPKNHVVECYRPKGVDMELGKEGSNTCWGGIHVTGMFINSYWSRPNCYNYVVFQPFQCTLTSMHVLHAVSNVISHYTGK